MRKLYLLFVIISVSCQILAQDPGTASGRISLLFIGDIMGHDEQIWSAENRETRLYNYDEVFGFIKEEISEADLAIGNFEVTLGGPPYTGYPQFSSPDALAEACKYAGIDCFVTANNHSADRSRKGITRTINILDSLNIQHTGTFTSKAQRDSIYPLIIEKKGFSLALLNYTYGTNGINVPPPAVVNMLDRNLVDSDIRKARSKNPDAVILFLHWGTEYDTVPSRSQTELAEYFLNSGADLVIGSHPHVLQKMVWIKGTDSTKDKVIVYSLGNFVSNQRRRRTDGGSMVRIDLERRGDFVTIGNTGYYLTWVYTPIENYRKKFYVLPCSKYENSPGFFSNPADYQKMRTFIQDSRKLLYNQNINFSEFIYSGNRWVYE